MADGLGSDKREKNVVILLTLVAIDGGDLVGTPNQWVVGTTLLNDVTYEVLLTIIRRENAYLVGRVA